MEKNIHSMKILTYNVSWQSMTGLTRNWDFCNTTLDDLDNRHFTKCIQGVTTMIDENGPFDFVALQEASNYELIIDDSTCLRKMNHLIHKSGKEFMLTFWNSSHNLIMDIKGDFQKGRPWHALIFNDICFVNIHAGHYSMEILGKKLAQMISSIKKHLTTQRIIIAGDFNFPINKYYSTVVLSKIPFYLSERYFNTLTNFKGKRGIQFDHIIDTARAPDEMYIPEISEMASDHLPVIAVL